MKYREISALVKDFARKLKKIDNGIKNAEFTRDSEGTNEEIEGKKCLTVPAICLLKGILVRKGWTSWSFEESGD